MAEKEKEKPAATVAELRQTTIMTRLTAFTDASEELDEKLQGSAGDLEQSMIVERARIKFDAMSAQLGAALTMEAADTARAQLALANEERAARKTSNTINIGLTVAIALAAIFQAWSSCRSYDLQLAIDRRTTQHEAAMAQEPPKPHRQFCHSLDAGESGFLCSEMACGPFVEQRVAPPPSDDGSSLAPDAR